MMLRNNSAVVRLGRLVSQISSYVSSGSKTVLTQFMWPVVLAVAPLLHLLGPESNRMLFR